jgi:hypothetical protein
MSCNMFSPFAWCSAISPCLEEKWSGRELSGRGREMVRKRVVRKRKRVVRKRKRVVRKRVVWKTKKRIAKKQIARNKP